MGCIALTTCRNAGAATRDHDSGLIRIQKTRANHPPQATRHLNFRVRFEFRRQGGTDPLAEDDEPHAKNPKPNTFVCKTLNRRTWGRKKGGRRRIVEIETETEIAIENEIGTEIGIGIAIGSGIVIENAADLVLRNVVIAMSGQELAPLTAG
ncbi:hypothetical protein EJ110_NYTH39146 [Nymphaea thermarum]|nr:hypothetical protein EJ110_NYTH39146 [Nymphaea thermarum]